MHRDGVAYIAIAISITCISSADAADGHNENPPAIATLADVNPSFILMNGFATTAVREPGNSNDGSEISSAGWSEQLRIYDQATPVVRITLPRPAVVSTRRTAARVSRSEAFRPLMDDVGRRYAIDPDLLRSIANVESGHNPFAVSPKGATGLMQVMPATGRRFGVADARHLSDPAVSLDVAASYLKTLQGRFGNNLPLVLAAYNAGEGAVQKYGGTIPPYRETQAYVRKVLGLYGEAVAGR